MANIHNLKSLWVPGTNDVGKQKDFEFDLLKYYCLILIY